MMDAGEWTWLKRKTELQKIIDNSCYKAERSREQKYESPGVWFEEDWGVADMVMGDMPKAVGMVEGDMPKVEGKQMTDG